MILNSRNRLGEAALLLRGALEHALAEELPAAATRASNNLAVSFESGDRYAEAVEESNRGLEIARRIGDRASEANFLAGPAERARSARTLGRGARARGGGGAPTASPSRSAN